MVGDIFCSILLRPFTITSRDTAFCTAFLRVCSKQIYIIYEAQSYEMHGLDHYLCFLVGGRLSIADNKRPSERSQMPYLLCMPSGV